MPLAVFQKEPFLVLKPENDTRQRAMELLQPVWLPAGEFSLSWTSRMTSYNITCSGMGISFIK